MKLELKHLAPYLPYNLNMKRLNKNNQIRYITMNNGNIMGPIEQIDLCKPILRPMSDLHNSSYKWMEIASSEAQSRNDEYVILKDYTKTENITVHFYFWLISNNFDVFGLIPAGLAIDINTVF